MFSKKAAYRAVSREIVHYTKGMYKPDFFHRHILGYLRKHPELCEQEDYKKLYEETIYMLLLHAQAKSGWTNSNPPHPRENIEILVDLYLENDDTVEELLTQDAVDNYLAYRKSVWAEGR